MRMSPGLRRAGREVVPHVVSVNAPLLARHGALDVAVSISPEALDVAVALAGLAGERIEVPMIARVRPVQQVERSVRKAIVDLALLSRAQAYRAMDVMHVRAGIAISAIV